MFNSDLLSAVNSANNLPPASSVSFATLPAGHPVDILLRENRALKLLLTEAETALTALRESVQETLLTHEDSASPDIDIAPLLAVLLPLTHVSGHYAKKQQLMPILDQHLKQSPSGPIWDLDVEIREDVKQTVRSLKENAGSLDQATRAIADTTRILTRLRAMIKKEEVLFYPLCLQTFTEEEWCMLYRDLKKRGLVWIRYDADPASFIWPAGEAWAAEDDRKRLERIRALDDLVLPLYGGDVTVRQLRGMLDVLPICLTFVDETETNTYFLDKTGPFARSLSALGRKMPGCHPPKLEPAIRSMLAHFRDHSKERVEMWISDPKAPARIVYQAIYDETGAYMGVLEMVESYTDVLEKLLSLVPHSDSISDHSEVL